MIRLRGSREEQKEVGNLVFIYRFPKYWMCDYLSQLTPCKTETTTLKPAMEGNWFTSKSGREHASLTSSLS